MNHYGTLRDYEFQDKDADDIRGSDVYGMNDEKLGEIDDVIFDHGTGAIRFVVVDTGGLLSSNLFLIPAERLRPSAEHEDDYQVNMTSQQVENLPAYNEKDVNDRDRWSDYEKRFEAAWEEKPVMHRKDAPDRIITPPHTDELDIANAGSAKSVNSSIVRPHTHLGDRWNSFEDRLRTDRVRIVGACGVCGMGPGSTGKEADRKRKVG
jgi:sporulation protein YlmC with PRC-barrel domain